MVATKTTDRDFDVQVLEDTVRGHFAGKNALMGSALRQNSVIAVRDNMVASDPTWIGNQVTVPYGLQIVQVGPSTVTMEFETSGIRKVRIEPDIDGRPAAGYEIVDVKAEPDSIEVAGPETALKRLQAAITEPVSVTDQTRTVHEVVTIGVPDPTLRLRVPQTAVVTVTIAPRKP